MPAHRGLLSDSRSLRDESPVPEIQAAGRWHGLSHRLRPSRRESGDRQPHVAAGRCVQSCALFHCTALTAPGAANCDLVEKQRLQARSNEYWTPDYKIVFCVMSLGYRTE